MRIVASFVWSRQKRFPVAHKKLIPLDWNKYLYKCPNSNQRLRECVRLVALYQTADTYDSQGCRHQGDESLWVLCFPLNESMALSSGLHIVLTENCCEKIWPRWTNFLLTMCQRVPNPAIITWLASTKAPKHVLTMGVKLNFQKSLITYLQEQIHTTNFLWQMKMTSQFNNQRH